MRLFRWSAGFADKYIECVYMSLIKQCLIEINEPENTAIVLAYNYT
jgi:hypothetical protein